MLVDKFQRAAYAVLDLNPSSIPHLWRLFLRQKHAPNTPRILLLDSLESKSQEKARALGDAFSQRCRCFPAPMASYSIWIQ